MINVSSYVSPQTEPVPFFGNVSKQQRKNHSDLILKKLAIPLYYLHRLQLSPKKIGDSACLWQSLISRSHKNNVSIKKLYTPFILEKTK